MKQSMQELWNLRMKEIREASRAIAQQIDSGFIYANMFRDTAGLQTSKSISNDLVQN